MPLFSMEDDGEEKQQAARAREDAKQQDYKN
jgi:hypothetical protein